jgi:hypothetical protein
MIIHNHFLRTLFLSEVSAVAQTAPESVYKYRDEAGRPKRRAESVYRDRDEDR